MANPNVLRILAAGDFHNDSLAAEKLAKKAKEEDVDLVLLCGDLSHMDHPPKNIIGPFLRERKPVCFIPGNHDSHASADFIAHYYGIKNLHGSATSYKDVGIFGCGFANIGLSQLPDEDFLKYLRQGFEKIEGNHKKIMVTHVHPAGGMAEKFTRFFKGSAAVTKAIYEMKPDIHICCHVHEAEGIEEKLGHTLTFNVGRRGRIIEIPVRGKNGPEKA